MIKLNIDIKMKEVSFYPKTGTIKIFAVIGFVGKE